MEKGGCAMGIGILVCGLNGAGKSTLGRALAERLGFAFIDNENLYFSRSAETEPYTGQRSEAEVVQLLLAETELHPDFVFAAVKGNYCTEMIGRYDYTVLVEVPRELRLQRIRERSFRKFGRRMLPGGDLYEAEEDFFRFAASRPEEYVENWIRTLSCPVIRVDGRRPVEENLSLILKRIKG